MKIIDLKLKKKNIFIFFITTVIFSLIYFYLYNKFLLNDIYKSYKTLFHLILIFFIFFNFIFRFNFFKELYLNIEKIISKIFFPSLEKEIYLYSIVRIFFGIIIFLRCLNIFLLNENFTLLENKLIFIELFFSVCLIFGFLSQLAILFFILIMWTTHGGQLDLKAYTLGNDIGSMLAIFLLFGESGRFVSIDSYLIKIRPYLTNYLLYKDKINSKEFLSILKFACLFSYCCVCIYSGITHLHDYFWTSGITGPLLLTSSYMSSMHNFFEILFTNSQFSIIFFKASMFIMMLWYFLLLPFVLIGGIFKKIVVVWGLLFFIISDQVLNLGSLGKIEYLLWAVLFWPPNFGLNKDGKNTMWVFYDDRCSLCDTTVKFLNKIDLFSVLNFKPASQSLNDLKKTDLSYENAMEDMHGYNVKERKFYKGFDFYFICSKRILLLFPFFPILFIAKHLKFGKILYRFIADRRRKIFGTCSIRPVSYFKKIEFKIYKKISYFRLSILSSIFVSGFFFLYSMPIPLINKTGYGLGIAGNASIFGIQHINVFNETDLKMSQNWFTLELIEKKKKSEIIPFYNIDGSRGHYHKSDRIYFGYSIAWRRNTKLLNFDTPSCQHSSEDLIFIYEKIVEIYLNENNYLNGVYEFFYNQYNKNNQADLLKKNLYIPGKIKKICIKKLKFRKNNKSIRYIS